MTRFGLYSRFPGDWSILLHEARRLSLQQSAMFFLLSMVLLVLGEYVTHMRSVNSKEPAYHIGQEFGSSIVSRRQRLNVEDTADAIPVSAVSQSSPAPHA